MRLDPGRSRMVPPRSCEMKKRARPRARGSGIARGRPWSEPLEPAQTTTFIIVEIGAGWGTERTNRSDRGDHGLYAREELLLPVVIRPRSPARPVPCWSGNIVGDALS